MCGGGESKRILRALRARARIAERWDNACGMRKPHSDRDRSWARRVLLVGASIGAFIVLPVWLPVGIVGRSDTPTPPVRSTESPAASAPTSSSPSMSSQPRSSEPPASESAPRVAAGDKARISIPAIGVRGVTTVFYWGSPDDAPGTRIQDTGRLAASIGSAGGVGPGRVGNLIVTGHRTSAGAPLGRLPELHNHDHVLVTFDDMVYDYEITGSLWITFHDPESYALQVAPVPGHPGRRATRPMITLSTCATPEDRAAGRTELDELGNPPHRIDKIGVLVDVRPAR